MLYHSFTAKFSHNEPKSRLVPPRIRTIVTGIRTAFSVIRTGRVNFRARKRLKIKKRDPTASLLFYPTSKISLKPEAQKDKIAGNNSGAAAQAFERRKIISPGR